MCRCQTFPFSQKLRSAAAAAAAAAKTRTHKDDHGIFISQFYLFLGSFSFMPSKNTSEMIDRRTKFHRNTYGAQREREEKKKRKNWCKKNHRRRRRRRHRHRHRHHHTHRWLCARNNHSIHSNTIEIRVASIENATEMVFFANARSRRKAKRNFGCEAAAAAAFDRNQCSLVSC